MPWTPSDAQRFTKKADSAIAKRQWRDVANAQIARGKSDKVAVMSANAAVAKRKDRDDRPKTFGRLA